LSYGRLSTPGLPKIHTPKFEMIKNISDPAKPKVNKFLKFIFLLIV